MLDTRKYAKGFTLSKDKHSNQTLNISERNNVRLSIIVL